MCTSEAPPQQCYGGGPGSQGGQEAGAGEKKEEVKVNRPAQHLL